MKLTLYAASDGDCLLLQGKDGRTLLVDGGRAESFCQNTAPDLGRMAAKDQPIDLICVSHIDGDHISGILELMDDMLAWRVYDYQWSRGNITFPEPRTPRPPRVGGIWHNSFQDLAVGNTAPIQAQLVANTNTLLSLSDLAGFAPQSHELALSIIDSLELANRVGPKQLRIPVNSEFGGKVVLAADMPACYPLGEMSITVVGPLAADLEKLRRDWNRWLAKNEEAVKKVRKEARADAKLLPMSEGQLLLSSIRTLAAELGQRSLVTPPNLASIMLLVEEGQVSVLLTGDGHAGDVLKGLAAQGKLDADGRLHVSALKIPHHGSEHNLTAEFCRRVTADHYIFCGNGAKENPNLDALRMLAEERLAAASGDFKFWFTSSSKTAQPEAHRVHMAAVEKEVRALVKTSRGRLKSKFLTKGTSLVLTV